MWPVPLNKNSKVNINVVRADSLLNQVLALYEVKKNMGYCWRIILRKKTNERPLSGR